MPEVEGVKYILGREKIQFTEEFLNSNFAKYFMSKYNLDPKEFYQVVLQ